MTFALASFGGIKAHENFEHNKKLKHFGGLRLQFNKALTKINPAFDGFIIPKWEDEEIWKKHFENPSNRKIYTFEGKNTTRDFSSVKELRDACYNILTQSNGEFKNCNPTGSWCDTCLMKNGWYKKHCTD